MEKNKVEFLGPPSAIIRAMDQSMVPQCGTSNNRMLNGTGAVRAAAAVQTEKLTVELIFQKCERQHPEVKA